MNMYKYRHNAGFTLVEILVAVAILAGGIIAVMRLFPSALVQTQTAAERTTVASLARHKLGNLRAGGFGPQLEKWFQENALHNLTETESAYDLYDSLRATLHRVGGRTGLYRATFVVEMLDGRQEKFVTYVAPY